MNSVYLWNRARLAMNQKEKYFSLPGHQLAENVILTFGFWEQNSDKRKFVNKFLGVIVMIIFI